ncbi:baculoviral IAP repeat-containing protein 7 isoform X3 [Brienomyrus brachyistius]|uniref:baculoviral IAP repeat-containing protein 7 isoform X3 n=1 Tax=Brienomyrus brachyistius TaxID=42636 RepID=UPI0020B3C51F|nr:baculoviral IAP repeat-containing protein 7 isoform X3 [Brienomyrus brachyistius]
MTATPSMSADGSSAMVTLVEPRMRSLEERIGTFRDWPSDAPVTAIELAKAGFYFIGPGDKVRCFYCGGVLRYWVRGDTPLGEHKKHFPTCGFTLGRNVGEIQNFSERGAADGVDGQLVSQLQRMTVDDQAILGQAAYPDMGAEESRVTTFQNWPTDSSAQPDVLARAGFFYTGHGDNVKCFYCDGGLRNWEPGDDPWQEHAKWFPRCEFLLQARGREYVSSVQESYFSISETLSASPISTARDLNSGHALMTPVIHTVLQMGFDANLVESLVQTKYLLTGTCYTSVSDLVADVLQAEEDGRRSQQARDPGVNQGRSAGRERIQTQARDKAAGELSAEEQLRQLQEERTCKVCMDKLVSMVFIPCGHLVVCTDCAASLRNCPICRAIIRGSVRAFMT